MNKNNHRSQESNPFTVRHIAKRLQGDDTTVRRWVNNGILEAVILPHMGSRLKQEALEKITHPQKNGPLSPFQS